MKNFDKLTIEDLRLIVAIVEEGSLSAGADRLGIGQSNASYALRKLQDAFGAALFSRKGRKLNANEFGQHAYAHTKRLLSSFDTAIAPPVFDSNEKFTLSFGATEYEIYSVFPKLKPFLSEQAPYLQLKIIALDSTDFTGQAEKFDFLFLPFEPSSAAFGSLKILDDEYVTIFDGSVREPPKSLEQFAAAPHAIASFDGKITTNIDHLLAEKGLSRKVILSVFGFAGLAELMKNTDYITTLPSGIAKGSFPAFTACHCPLDIAAMPLYLCWASGKEKHGKHRWLIELVSKLFLSK